MKILFALFALSALTLSAAQFMPARKLAAPSFYFWLSRSQSFFNSTRYPNCVIGYDDSSVTEDDYDCLFHQISRPVIAATLQASYQACYNLYAGVGSLPWNQQLQYSWHQMLERVTERTGLTCSGSNSVSLGKVMSAMSSEFSDVRRASNAVKHADSGLGQAIATKSCYYWTTAEKASTDPPAERSVCTGTSNAIDETYFNIRGFAGVTSYKIGTGDHEVNFTTLQPFLFDKALEGGFIAKIKVQASLYDDNSCSAGEDCPKENPWLKSTTYCATECTSERYVVCTGYDWMCTQDWKAEYYFRCHDPTKFGKSPSWGFDHEWGNEGLYQTSSGGNNGNGGVVFLQYDDNVIIQEVAFFTNPVFYGAN